MWAFLRPFESFFSPEDMERNSEAVIKRCQDRRLIFHYNAFLQLDEYPLKRGP